MIEINKEILFAFLVVIFLWWLFGPSMEGLSEDGTTVVPLGQPRYGLRGDLLRSSSIDKLYYPPNRNIRLHQTSNWMYQGYPDDCSLKGCKKVSCPINTNEYDPEDTCWSCSGMDPEKTKIPYIHPH